MSIFHNNKIVFTSGLIFFVTFSQILCSEIQKWPFELADKYVEEFKSNADALMQAALTNEFREEGAYTAEQIKEANTLETAEVYDFIIVGGGTSGSVLATRLSEVPEWRILLLEAGGLENEGTKIPKYWELAQNTPLNWGYHTTPQNYSCLGMVDHKCAVPTGRALGGSTTINSMLYTRGNARDYDLWADQGNKGWCYADVLPYFKSIENSQLEHFDHKYHHQGGPQNIQHPQYLSEAADYVLKAGKELGIETVDYNGKTQMGLSVAQLTTDCGRRFSTKCAYLDQTKKRKNLVVKPLSQVTKVIISPHIKEAKGVEFIHEGKLYVAKAEKEVILAAGALNTPKILILSGVGPKEECEKHKIENIINLKVGYNLRTRPIFLGLDFVENHTSIEHVNEHQDLLNYLKYGNGPLTSPGIEVLGFIKTEVAKGHVPYPDVELRFSNRLYSRFDSLRGLRLDKQQYHAHLQPLEGKRGLHVDVILNHPKSTGYVGLNEHNPLGQPIIEPHLLADHDQKDFHAILAGIKKVIKLSHTETFQKLGLKINHSPVHGCEAFEFLSEEYWGCAVKYLVSITGEASGTCRMGPEKDKEAVVDNHLRVHGIHNLRVADSSVIPVCITGELAGPTIMIGEKAAHLIKTQWEEDKE